jgi:integrase
MNAENVKFYLHNPKSENPTSIYAKFYLHGREVKISIGLNIYPELWDKASQLPITDKQEIKYWRKHDPTIKVVLDNITSRINKVKHEITSYINLKEQAGEQITRSMVREHVKSTLGLVEKKTSKTSIVDFTDTFIKDIETGKRLTSDKSRYATSTIKNYRGFLSQFKAFQKQLNKVFSFQDINLSVYDKYVEFFQSKNYSPNTTGRHIKILKVIMRSAEEDGLHSNKVYTDKRFRLLTAPVDSIYLTNEEIEKMRKLDLSKKPTYELVRDVFVLGTQTALRFSDFSRIRHHHVVFHGDDMIKLKMYMKKTDGIVEIPINSIVKEVLRKYDCNIPPVTEQVFNRYIKTIGQWAGIDQHVEVIKHKGAKKEKYVVPKYELISTHTARRSAATNMVKSTGNLELVRRVTGHSTTKNLLKYIRLKEDEVYEQLKNDPFFKK